MIEIQTTGNSILMSPFSHFVSPRRKNLCAAVVLLAVCSLTMSLATRYGALWGNPCHTVRTVQTHASTDAKKQRLAKKAVNWIPPVVCFWVLQATNFDSRIALAGPRVIPLLLEESLYNRPPPII
jgi:hypothetical protein